MVKNCENTLIFHKVRADYKVAPFLCGHSVCSEIVSETDDMHFLSNCFAETVVSFVRHFAILSLCLFCVICPASVFSDGFLLLCFRQPQLLSKCRSHVFRQQFCCNGQSIVSHQVWAGNCGTLLFQTVALLLLVWFVSSVGYSCWSNYIYCSNSISVGLQSTRPKVSPSPSQVVLGSICLRG